jgi:hypothetical protein
MTIVFGEDNGVIIIITYIINIKWWKKILIIMAKCGNEKIMA